MANVHDTISAWRTEQRLREQTRIAMFLIFVSSALLGFACAEVMR